MTTFDPRQYWENRLHARFDLDGVGNRGCGLHVNRWAYRARRRVFWRTVRRLNFDLAAARVLDLGSGTGFYLDSWHKLGAHDVTGVDLTDTAVEHLRRSHPRLEIHRVDIGCELGPLTGATFDLVSCMDVLFHLVDDDAYLTALRNVHSLLRPGGRFIFSEGFPPGIRRGTHIVHRPRADILELLERAGLVHESYAPFLVLMNDPVEPGARLSHFLWNSIGLASNRWRLADRTLGPLLYPLELAAGRLLKSGPSTKIMVCRRAEDDPRAPQSHRA